MHTLLTRLISPVKKVIKGVCFYLVVVGAVLARPQLALAQTALSDPSMKGKVIDLGDGNPWLVVQSTAQTGTKSGYVYIMAMYNYGNYAWGLSNTNPSTAISTTSDVGTIYTNLPATIDGVAKAVALGSHTWQWDSCTQTGSCTNTVTSVSPISFVSYREWQGTTLDAWGDIESEPSFGSVGQLFCTAWKGIVCVGSGISSNFNYPWLRSGTTLDSGSAWSIGGSPLTGGMMSGRDVTLSYGSLPIAWLSSSFCTSGGLGTYASPHTLEVCNTPPTLPTPDPTVTNSADPSIGAFASYVSEYSSLTLAGTVNDLDVGQTLTIQYQIDSTAGSWSNLTTLTANGSNQPWSGTVNLPAGLSAGSHTIYIRVYDGYTYSPNKSVNF
ncbi:hypothetical protein FWH30_03590, partial [Microgenomates group bacterium]|nr:hypothetical protein [Microgenomates group bacterium]